jgi:hypothetical protein
MRINPLRIFSGVGQFASITILAVLAIAGFAPRANAFSLLGPYADWMVQSNSYHQGDDIGGPMNLNEEYRWNVPVVTYGFDQSFLDYFGSNGVAAVESAIQTLNDLPAASDIVLSDYPADTRGMNFAAAAQHVYDLKSAVLARLLEQLGLGQPVRNIVDIRRWTSSLTAYQGGAGFPDPLYFPDFLIERNFDPQTLAPSVEVNGAVYTAFLITNGSPTLNDFIEAPVDPIGQSPYSAVADAFSVWYNGIQSGNFYIGLTKDDVGGLTYLLSATNVNWESLPRNVLFTGHQRHVNQRLRGAWRPGVEKITFVRQPQNGRGKFKTAVLEFTARYVTNGVVSEQPAKRVVSQPDILFSVDGAVDGAVEGDPISPVFVRTGTDKWTNNASQNGDPTAAGPGVINPPVKITLAGICRDVATGENDNPAVFVNYAWASFDQSTNPPVIYPPNMGQTNLLVRLHFYVRTSSLYTEITNSSFQSLVAYGALATLQISTNAPDWISVATVTNTGAVVRWDYFGTQIPISFRVVPGTQ